MIRDSDALIACTNFEKNLFIKLGARRSFVIPMGIWVNEWMSTKKSNMREIYGLEDYFIILVPAKSYYKGTYHVLSASTILKKHGINVAVITIGGGSSRVHYLEKLC